MQGSLASAKFTSLVQHLSFFHAKELMKVSPTTKTSSVDFLYCLFPHTNTREFLQVIRSRFILRAIKNQKHEQQGSLSLFNIIVSIHDRATKIGAS